MPCSPDTVPRFTAVGYHFGKTLHDELKIPIGLIQAAVGGTAIERWTPVEGFRKLDSLKKWAEENFGMTPESRSLEKSDCYNRMIHPLKPLTMRGVIWYQGEANVARGTPNLYIDKMNGLINGWRDVFKQDDLSFYCIQVRPYIYSKIGPMKKRHPDLTAETLPRFWEAQAACMKTIENCGMVVAADLVDIAGHIHQHNKRDVGYRLALWAMAKNYGKKDTVYSGPMYKAMNVSHDSKIAKIVLEFDHIGGGLKSLVGPLSEFTIAGEDRKFVEARAVINGNCVEVSSRDVPKPVAVRYAWHEMAFGNLANKEGLPAAPFRTDDW